MGDDCRGKGGRNLGYWDDGWGEKKDLSSREGRKEKGQITQNCRQTDIVVKNQAGETDKMWWEGGLVMCKRMPETLVVFIGKPDEGRRRGKRPGNNRNKGIGKGKGSRTEAGDEGGDNVL